MLFPEYKRVIKILFFYYGNCNGKIQKIEGARGIHKSLIKTIYLWLCFVVIPDPNIRKLVYHGIMDGFISILIFWRLKAESCSFNYLW